MNDLDTNITNTNDINDIDDINDINIDRNFITDETLN